MDVVYQIGVCGECYHRFGRLRWLKRLADRLVCYCGARWPIKENS